MFVRVLEVLILLKQRRFIDVVVGGDAVVVGDLGQLPHVVEIVAADIDVEEDGVAVSVLLADQVVELLANRRQRFGQARS